MEFTGLVNQLHRPKMFYGGRSPMTAGRKFLTFCQSLGVVAVAVVPLAGILFLASPSAVAADQYMWNLKMIGVKKSMHNDKKKRGTGVKVGVLDGLVRCKHRELGKSRCKGYIHKDGTYTKFDDHGTHVATTIAANNSGSTGMVGVAPFATILSYGIFDDDVGMDGEEKAIDSARSKGARVINMSYGPNERIHPGVLFLPGAAGLNAMIKAKNKNVVFVKAAGNKATILESYRFLGTVNASVSLKNLIIVGGIGRNKKIDTNYSNVPGVSCFLSAFDTACKEKNFYAHFFVVAPGTKIYAGKGNGSYYKETGTSMAAPHVTGVVALLQGYWPVLKKRAGAVTNIIFHTAQDLGAPGVDMIYGWGMVRADRAMGPLGKKYLSKNEKVYALSSSKLRVSQALAVLTSERVAFFDKYDRDFQIPLASSAPSYSGTLNRWMTAEDSQQNTNRNMEDGLSFVIDNEQYDPNDPSLSDIPFHLSYQGEDGFVWHFGQGNSTERLESPESLTFGLMREEGALSGAYPVLAIAEGGTYGLLKQPLGQGFSLTSGALSNARLDSNDEDRGYAPKANALVLSLDRISKNRKLSGHVTATYLTEEEGVLGTGGVGGLHFTDGFDSNAITVGTQYRMPDDYNLSASYTKAFSSGDTVSDGVLALHNSKLSSTAFAVGLEKRKLVTNSDYLKFSISQPLRVELGYMTLTHDDYYDEDEVLHSRTVGIDLGSSGRQIDYQLQYTRPLSKNRKLGLFVYYAQDYLHQAHHYDYGLGIKINGSF